MKIERWLENEKKRCIESSTSLKGVVCVKFLDVFWFCFVGLGGWCRGVGSVEELVHKVFGDLVSKCGVSVVSVVDAFDELADFCSCLDHAGKAVFVEEHAFFHSREKRLSNSIVLGIHRSCCGIVEPGSGVG